MWRAEGCGGDSADECAGEVVSEEPQKRREDREMMSPGCAAADGRALISQPACYVSGAFRMGVTTANLLDSCPGTLFPEIRASTVRVLSSVFEPRGCATAGKNGSSSVDADFGEGEGRVGWREGEGRTREEGASHNSPFLSRGLPYQGAAGWEKARIGRVIAKLAVVSQITSALKAAAEILLRQHSTSTQTSLSGRHALPNRDDASR